MAGLLSVPGISTGATGPTRLPAPGAAISDSGAGTASTGTVTLVTGDTVTVHADGTVTVAPDPHRADISLTTYQRDGHVHVVPSDAAPLLAEGRIDPQLFNVTALLEYGYGEPGADLPLIVVGNDVPIALSGATRELPAAGGVAVQLAGAAATGLWRELAATERVGVWLDRPYQVRLDTSVPQVGAPLAWDAGYDGTGTTVAVLDTGIDAAHPDLAGKVVGQANFTGEADADLHGHGTHVAATVAGTGAASGGDRSGVAPGASVLDGKVCDAAGNCLTSAIIEGMQWAAEQGADVVNLSLGAPDTAGVDPLEEAVDSLTASHGTLFVIAAGNTGAARTVESPASADAALAVGAVDASDALAGFSSQGPRTGDSALKPEITAPGVGIFAARSQDSERPGDAYTELSGTSMATPHVAGAAAILTQRQPDWPPELRKAALMGSAAPDPALTAFAQGAGRLSVGDAIELPVTTEPAAVSLGLVEQGTGDGETVETTVTYTNHGTDDLTLSLDLATLGPGGSAPAGTFALDQGALTVPAQGEASVTLTAAVGTPGPAGLYSGWIVASADGGTVARTPFGFERAVPLTFDHIGRDGGPPVAYTTFVMRVDGPEQFVVSGEPGPATVWVPEGTYLVTSSITDAGPDGEHTTILAVPQLDADEPQSYEMDARQAQEIDIGVPDDDARLWATEIGFQLELDGSTGFSITSAVRSGSAYTAPVASTPAGFRTKITSNLIRPGPDGDERGAPLAYYLAWFFDGELPTGFTRQLTDAELATVTAPHAAHIDDGLGYKTASARPASGVFASGITFGLPFELPFDRTERYSTADGVGWVTRFAEHVAGSNENVVTTESSPITYDGGSSLEQSWNRPVHWPGFAAPVTDADWVSRAGDELRFRLPLLGDGDGHAGLPSPEGVDGQVTITANGDIVHEGPYEPQFGRIVAVPPQAGTVQLAATAQRGGPAVLSTQVSAVWTFQSESAGNTPVRQPLWTVQMTPPLDGANTAPAGAAFSIPVLAQPQPGSAAGELAELAVEFSVDDGETWQPATVSETGDGHVAELAHPDATGFVSLRAEAVDSAGNAVEQEVIRAYRIA